MDQGWEYYSTGQGRIEVVNGALRMDDAVKDKVYSLNEAVLHLNLANTGNVQLKLDHQTFGDANHTYGRSSFADHANADLIAVSVDGKNWVKVTDLKGNFTGKRFSLDALLSRLDPDATNRFDVRIKFQQYDRYPWGSMSSSSDGRAFDNIQVTGDPMVYSQRFSAEKPNHSWEYYSTNQGRIEVVNGTLRMDDAVRDRVYSLNEAVLHVNLANTGNVQLKLDHQTFGDTNHAYGRSSFAGHVNADLIAVSVDGENWVKVTDLKGNFTGKTFPLDGLLSRLDPDATNRFDVRIKFQQYDRYPWGSKSSSSDGRAFDNIVITATASSPLSVVPSSVPPARRGPAFVQSGLHPVAEAAVDQIYLLSVAPRELGQIAGLNDSAVYSEILMSASHSPGIRKRARTAEVDAVFASGRLFAS
jgi:hypothetical protein